MKKAGYLLITVLEILLLVGAYVVHYFTKKKMGMARYVMYKNRGWEQAYPLALLKSISVAVLLVLLIIVLVLAVRSGKRLRKVQWGMCIVMVLLSVLSFAVTLGSSIQSLRAYYFISPMLAGALLLQIGKTGIGILIGGKQDEA